MKKKFRTFIDITAQQYDTIFVSAGQVGNQIEVSPKALADLVRAEFAALTV